MSLWVSTAPLRAGANRTAAPGGWHVATELGLRFGLKLLGQQHVGLFLDTRPARAAVATRPGPATGRCVT